MENGSTTDDTSPRTTSSKPRGAPPDLDHDENGNNSANGSNGAGNGGNGTKKRKLNTGRTSQACSECNSCGMGYDAPLVWSWARNLYPMAINPSLGHLADPI